MGVSSARHKQRVSATELILRLRQSGDPVFREQLVLMHERLVYSIARRFASSGEPIEDLVQEGFIGLLRAIELFDARRGVRFSTYAAHKITGAIQHYLRDKARMIRQPAWVQELRRKILRETANLSAQLGRDPTPAELAAALHIAECEVLAAASALTCVVESLDQLVQTNGMGGWLVRLDMVVGAQGLQSVEEQVALNCALESLPALYRDAVRLFYYEGLSYNDIARALNVSCSKARRLVVAGVRAMKRHLVPGESLQS